MIGGRRVAARHAIERRGSEGGFNRQRRLRVGGRRLRRRAGQREDSSDVREVFGAQLDGAVVGLEVVVAIGQGEAGLIHGGDLLRGVGAIGPRAEAEQHRHAVAMKVRDEHRQVVRVQQLLDRGEVRGDRVEAGRFDLRLVHARGVVVRGLLPIAFGTRRFEDAAQDREVPLLQLGEASVRPPIGRHRVSCDPAAAGELVEVGARIGLAVERVQLDAFRLRDSRLRRAWLHGRHCTGAADFIRRP